MNKDRIIRPAIILILICVLVTVAVAFVESITKDKINFEIEKAELKARKEVLIAADSFEIIDIDETIKSDPKYLLIKEVYKGKTEGKVIGHVFKVIPKGYGGDMTIMVGIDNEGMVSGVNIGDNYETPGLGSKATEEPFLSQFFSRKPEDIFKVVKNKKPAKDEIEAVSGATITSKAVVKAVQTSVDLFNLIKEKENNDE